MKNIILIFLFLIISTPVLAKNTSKTELSNEELETRLLQNINIEETQQKNTVGNNPIYDELINDSYTSNISNDDIFKVTVTKNSPRIIKNIADELISKEYINKAGTIRHIEHKKNYDFSQKTVPIKIKIANHMNFKNSASEGDIIQFAATHDFSIAGKTYQKGTTIWGRLETISASDMMGVPETVRIDNFYIDVNNDKNSDNDINLHGHITKEGANRTLWIYPLYQAGNMAFYAAGYLFVPIHGGHAKISPDEEFTLFYETASENKMKTNTPPQKKKISYVKKKSLTQTRKVSKSMYKKKTRSK